jgi:hypothetical protein
LDWFIYFSDSIRHFAAFKNKTYLIVFWDFMPCSLVDRYLYLPDITLYPEHGGTRFLEEASNSLPD